MDVVVCFFPGCGWLDDDNQDEGGVVGVSLHPIVNHSRAVKEINRRGCGADAQ